jgi:hypothetical protein
LNTNEISVVLENEKPKINPIINTTIVDMRESKPMVVILDKINSFLLNPSITFCLNIFVVNSFEIVKMIINPKNILSNAVI